MTTVTTIFADVDGSGVRAVYARKDVREVAETLKGGGLVCCDSDLGEVWVASGAVKSLQPGRRTLPVSAGPSSAARSERASYAGG